MKKLTKISALFLLAATLFTGCGKTDKIMANGAASLTPVDSYLTQETREYKDEGTIEEPIATYTSDDGLCVIKKMPSYYDITLDYENGTRAEVGAAYGRVLKEQLPEYCGVMEPYLYENIRMAYRGEYFADAIEQRIDCLWGSVRPEYREEIEAYAEAVSGGVHGINEDGVLSYEEAVLAQIIPDALRQTCCSALSLWGSKTSSGDRITLRNLDWNLGSENQMGMFHAVTHMKNGDRSITAFAMLGILDVISGINDDGVFAAILDVGSKDAQPYLCEGKKCYTLELRYALEEYSSARDLGEFMIGESGDFTWCHNLIISDKNYSFCAEDCVSQVAEKGLGKSVLRDCDTPLLEGLTWDSKDSLCVVNSFATEGNQDEFTGSSSNIIRFAKFNEWTKARDKFSPKDVKDMITQEVVNQYAVQNCHVDGCAQSILVDYHTGTVQIAFSSENGVADKPDFIEVERFGI